MRRIAIRVWFALAAAIVAAAVADPCVEAASNAGWFGPGTFTDHSNLDVIPALLAGAVVLAVYLVLRVRRELVAASNDALRHRVWSLLPVIFALQVGILYAMETGEQLAVYGHSLGGLIWLGGPVAFSLGVHAVFGVLITVALVHLVAACARTTVGVIRRIRALATRALHDPPPIARWHGVCTWRRSTLLLYRIGDRAPPFAFG